MPTFRKSSVPIAHVAVTVSDLAETLARAIKEPKNSSDGHPDA